MRTLSRRDVGSAFVTGLTTGVIGWQILVYLGKQLPLGLDPVLLAYVVPLLWLVGVQFGYFLGGYIRPFTQFGRFACIGFANAMVDFGVLYVGIAQTGMTGGVGYTILKSLSFAVATVHSYVWNKYWAFDAGRAAVTGREVISFIGVAASSLVVNVAVASFVNLLKPAGFTPEAWAGIGAVAGSAAALVFSFTGFRLFVFRKK